jgi:hypothetical protein
MASDRPQARAERFSTQTLMGVGLLAVSVGIFIGLLFVIGLRSSRLPRVTPNAVIFVDARGRIAVDGTLQVDGPAPIPVSAGTRTLTFLDAPTAVPPLTAAVAAGQFLYVVPDLQEARAYAPRRLNPKTGVTLGVVSASVFPPDGLIEIPDCTPVDAKRPVRCQSGRALIADLSSGTYTVRFTHPLFPAHEENVTVGLQSIVRVQHSFITTTDEWEQWRKDHGDVLQQLGRYRHRSGAEDSVLLPLEAVGAVFRELFD